MSLLDSDLVLVTARIAEHAESYTPPGLLVENLCTSRDTHVALVQNTRG